MRIGHGYDVHQLVEGRKLILGGVDIAHSQGLLGHSDADVLLHAICDAILGAVGSGDIGRHFPDNDEQFAGIASTILLQRVIAEAEKAGWQVGNIDSTVIAQRPRLAEYLEQMAYNIAAACRVDVNQINVKATTTEHLGFAGRGEGIAAHAVVLMEKRSDKLSGKVVAQL